MVIGGIGYGMSKGISSSLASSKLSKIIGTTSYSSKINKRLATAGYSNLKIGKGMNKVFSGFYKQAGYETLEKTINNIYGFGMDLIF